MVSLQNFVVRAYCWKHHILELENMKKPSWYWPRGFIPISSFLGSGKNSINDRRRKVIISPTRAWTLQATVTTSLARHARHHRTSFHLTSLLEDSKTRNILSCWRLRLHCLFWWADMPSIPCQSGWALTMTSWSPLTWGLVSFHQEMCWVTSGVYKRWDFFLSFSMNPSIHEESKGGSEKKKKTPLITVSYRTSVCLLLDPQPLSMTCC